MSMSNMSCPCRLASGEIASDRDIVCPCAYRPADVREYGSCYCGLYVSSDWNDGVVDHVYVPERRPPGGEKKFMKEKGGEDEESREGHDR
ncbi:MAG: hypothetical protein ACD_75C01910G0001 [uncultured bacterium]|nr:MAG: hypothetical protein ACD_75C01910G0001 [uncultured bacterium]